MTRPTRKSTGQSRPLSVWELPKLATLVHTYRKSDPQSARLRAHFPAILAFVYRNRLAVASQVQRRFSQFFQSDRTARRHLAEMESLGLLGVQTVTGVSPLMPKPYFVTRTGLTHLRREYARRGIDWDPYVSDRRRIRGQSFPHVWHDLATTEFLLSVWETARDRADVDVPVNERRSLVRHSAFAVPTYRAKFLCPDALFLFRQRQKGMMCCLVEIDTGSESEQKLQAKLEAYERWAVSASAEEFLLDLYRRHGARRPRPVFRLLFVVCGRDNATNLKRLHTLGRCVAYNSSRLRSRIWMTSADQFVADQTGFSPLELPIWLSGAAKSSNSRKVRDDDEPRFNFALFPQQETSSSP